MILKKKTPQHGHESTEMNRSSARAKISFYEYITTTQEKSMNTKGEKKRFIGL